MANDNKPWGTYFDSPDPQPVRVEKPYPIEREQILEITIGKSSAQIINGVLKKWELGDGMTIGSLRGAVDSAQRLLAEVIAATGEEGAPSPYVVAAAPAMHSCLTQVRDGLASWADNKALRNEMVKRIDQILFSASGDEIYGQGEEVSRK